MSKNELLTYRKEHFCSSLKTSYQTPIMFLKAKGCYLYDENDEEYLDVYNNVPHVGHSHPKVIEAITKQISLINTNTRYIHPNLTKYAEKLLQKFPKELSVCFFVNSGSEASDLAIRLCTEFTKAKDLVVLENSYHGNSKSCIEISTIKHKRNNLFNGTFDTPSHINIAPVPDTLKNPNKTGSEWANDAKDVIKGVKNLAGFFAESIQGCGGQVVYPEGYLKDVYKYIREAGGVCVADEVQVGFGRVGTHFWAFETQDVIPDIVVLGKPIGNGYPLGAVITRKEIAESMKVEYFNTFGGSPVSCAVGISVLEAIEEDKLQENALIVGNYLMEGLKQLKEKFPLIAQVRGLGLYIGIEFLNQDSSPATTQAKEICEELRNLKILTGIDGPFQNVLRLKPPICFSKKDSDRFLNGLSKVLDKIN